MTMNKEFVTFEQAVELKKLLYGEHYGDDYLGWYSSNKDFHYRNMNSPVYPNNQSFITPLKQQVFRWFREKYNMLACIYSNASGFLYEYHDTIGGTHRFDSGFTGDCEYSGAFTTYEKAENASIDKLIEIAKQQDK
jgi:hypothetical protein